MIGLSANTYIKMSDVYESMSFKGPTFDGEKESWAYYKVKMESYLARRDLAKFLTEREIPKDDSKRPIRKDFSTPCLGDAFTTASFSRRKHTPMFLIKRITEAHQLQSLSQRKHVDLLLRY